MNIRKNVLFLAATMMIAMTACTGQQKKNEEKSNQVESTNKNPLAELI